MAVQRECPRCGRCVAVEFPPPREWRCRDCIAALERVAAAAAALQEAQDAEELWWSTTGAALEFTPQFPSEHANALNQDVRAARAELRDALAARPK